MHLSTKKCLLSYAGVIMVTFGFGLMLDGSMYFKDISIRPADHQIVKAVSHWCGILLVLLGARNFTFGLAQWKHGMNCCGGGACEVVFVNFLALIFSLASAGLPVYGSFNFLQNTNASDIGNSAEFVYLIGIWFMSLMCAFLALLSMFAGCCSIDMASEEDEIEMQQYGHDNPQFNNKY